MIRILSFAIALFALQSAPDSRAETVLNCTPTREYITALGFLRSTPELGLKEEDARRIAEQVSSHCTDSAGRFVRVTRMLLKAGMAGTDAVRIGLEMAASDDKNTATFITVFKHAFLADFLDLSLSASLRIARSLSVDFDGDVLAVGNDFEQLVKFCTEDSKLGMPKPQCATWSAELAKKGQEFGGGIAKPFLQAFNFLVSPKGPSLAYGQAAKIARELIEISPHAVKNFVQAYQFGVDSQGLKLNTQAAIAFARKMASQTRAERGERKVAKSKGQG